MKTANDAKAIREAEQKKNKKSGFKNKSSEAEDKQLALKQQKFYEILEKHQQEHLLKRQKSKELELAKLTRQQRAIQRRLTLHQVRTAPGKDEIEPTQRRVRRSAVQNHP